MFEPLEWFCLKGLTDYCSVDVLGSFHCTVMGMYVRPMKLD